MIFQQKMTVNTSGRGMINVTADIADIISQVSISTGICNVFLHHTSASLILCENADSAIQEDLENFMQRLIPDDETLFRHNMEGPDDMPAHIRSILTQNSLTIPITNSRLNLGTWQGVFLWEHRFATHARNLTITLMS
jgi:secondary thiamine-phosphate synthase enzyme